MAAAVADAAGANAAVADAAAAVVAQAGLKQHRVATAGVRWTCDVVTIGFCESMAGRAVMGVPFDATVRVRR